MVRQAIHRWEEEGLTGLWDEKRVGRKRRWTTQDWEIIEQCLEQERSYTSKQLAQKLKEETAVELGPEQVRRILPKKIGEVNYKVLEILSQGHSETYGHPQPTLVPLSAKKGKAILVSGHDIKILAELLEATKDRGINVYTHGELLPAHSYPKLKRKISSSLCTLWYWLGKTTGRI